MGKPAPTRARLATSALVAVCLLGPLLLLLHGWLHPAGSDLPSPTRGGPRASGAVLLSVDGLPASALRLFDGERTAPPALDALAQLGIEVWLHQGAVTAEPAAAASLVSGLLPSRHGVPGWSARLGADVPLLAEAFAAAGLATAGFSNLPLFSASGLGRGLGVTGELPAGDADALAAAAGAWLAGLGDEGFLLWVHLHPGREPDGALAGFDRLVGGVVEGLRAARLFEGATLVATGTFGRRGPGRAGDPSAPLIVKLPRRASAASVRVGPTSTLDLAPSLLDFMRLPGLPGAHGRSLLAGRPMPLRSGVGLPAPALVEWLEADGPRLVLRDAEGAVSDEPGAYDLRADPNCLRNRHGSPAGEALERRLGAELDARRANLGPLRAPEAADVDGPTRAWLAELGYVLTPR